MSAPGSWSVTRVRGDAGVFHRDDPLPRRSATVVEVDRTTLVLGSSQPDTAVALMRARIFRPWALANSSDVTSVADAPSVRGEEVPAVTVPFASKAGFKTAKDSAVVSGRIVPSFRYSIHSSSGVLATLSNSFTRIRMYSGKISDGRRGMTASRSRMLIRRRSPVCTPTKWFCP